MIALFYFCLYNAVLLHQNFFSVDARLLALEPNQLSPPIKNFIDKIVEENHHEKEGFLLIIVNKVEAHFIDYAINQINKNSTVSVVNLYENFNTDPIATSPNYLKLALGDPEGDISFAGASFNNLKFSRSKNVLILTTKPPFIFIELALNTYWTFKCFNTIIAYENYGKIEILTYNAYLPTLQKVQNLTTSTDLFYEKTRNLYGATIKCLLTYRDRTKIKKVQKDGKEYYEGKDFLAIQTMLNYINAKMEIVTMDNIILNPWFDSLIIVERNQRKLSYLMNKNISVLVKSERFTIDDEVVDNLYPHAQNDIVSLAPKSSEIPMGVSMVMVFTPSMWLIHFLNTIVMLILWICIRKLFRKKVDVVDLYFNISRVSITNSIASVPKSTFEKFLIVQFLLGSFIINMFVQSKITSYLAIKKYYPEIDTIEGLFKSGLPLHSIHTHIEELEKKYVGTEFEKFVRQYKELASNEGMMDQATYRVDVSKLPSFLMEYDIALFVSRYRKFRRNGVQAYHVVKESVIPNYQSYKVIHNSPLLPIFDKVLRRLEEGGFINLWARWSIYNATVEGFLYPEGYDDSTIAKSLSLDVMLIWFNLLAAGYTMAGFFFLMEVLSNKALNKKIKK